MYVPFLAHVSFPARPQKRGLVWVLYTSELHGGGTAAKTFEGGFKMIFGVFEPQALMRLDASQKNLDSPAQVKLLTSSQKAQGHSGAPGSTGVCHILYVRRYGRLHQHPRWDIRGHGWQR